MLIDDDGRDGLVVGVGGVVESRVVSSVVDVDGTRCWLYAVVCCRRVVETGFTGFAFSVVFALFGGKKLKGFL